MLIALYLWRNILVSHNLERVVLQTEKKCIFEKEDLREMLLLKWDKEIRGSKLTNGL